MLRSFCVVVMAFGSLAAGCSALRTTSSPPSQVGGIVQAKPNNYNCQRETASCVALPVKVGIALDEKTKANVCTIVFTFQDYYLPRGRDATWKLEPTTAGTFRFKEVRDGSRLSLGGIHIQDLSEFPEFGNARYGATPDVYIWTSTADTRRHRHPYTINVEWRLSASDRWQDCVSDDPVVVNSF